MGAQEGGRGNQSTGKTGKDGKGKGSQSAIKGSQSFSSGAGIAAIVKKELKSELMKDMAKLLKSELATALAQNREGGAALVKEEAVPVAAQGTKKDPWDCSACGTKYNWGTKLECRSCGAARMVPNPEKQEGTPEEEVVSNLGSLTGQRDEILATIKALESLPDTASKTEWLGQSRSKLSQVEEEMRKSQPVQVRLRIAAMQVETTGKLLLEKESALADLKEKAQQAEADRDEAWIAHSEAEDRLAQASAAVGQATSEVDMLSPEQLLHALCKRVMERSGESTTGKSKAAGLVAGLHSLLSQLEEERAMEVDPPIHAVAAPSSSGKEKGVVGADPTPAEAEARRLREEQEQEKLRKAKEEQELERLRKEAAERTKRLEALAAARATAKRAKEEEEAAAAEEAARQAGIANGTLRDRSPRLGPQVEPAL